MMGPRENRIKNISNENDQKEVGKGGKSDILRLVGEGWGEGETAGSSVNLMTKRCRRAVFIAGRHTFSLPPFLFSSSLFSLSVLMVLFPSLSACFHLHTSMISISY
uniref:Transmembrane protein n=1 Tax=Trypanosoma vivax (strain Y486) TaxID=1055687 RepID=G0U7M2_TRYVY|nr:hypothetical protein TVY486_1009250 [Trypanosoma vivax Y486]